MSRGSRGRWAGALVLLAALALLAPGASPQAPHSAAPPVRVEITAKPIAHFDTRDPTRVRFGALEFRGGLELTSSNKDFGGLSALRVSPDGGFIALTDRARWLRGRIVSEAGRPVRITDAEMAPILGPDGRPLVQRGWYDTEALADDGGTLYVGIEGVNQILRFDFGKDGLSARGRPIPVPSAFASLPHNRGIEGLVFVPRGLPLGGTLMAFSERALDPKGNIKAFLIGGPSPGQSISQSTSQLTVRRSDDFDITDAAVTPSGDLFLLERRFAWTRGLAIRIRRLSLGSLNPNAPVDGPVVLDADLGQQIDNFEGLSAHRTAGGDTVLTLIADDNFSILQRTLLMQFTVVGE